jgi:hypothetical protein
MEVGGLEGRWVALSTAAVSPIATGAGDGEYLLTGGSCFGNWGGVWATNSGVAETVAGGVAAGEVCAGFGGTSLEVDEERDWRWTTIPKTVATTAAIEPVHVAASLLFVSIWFRDEGELAMHHLQLVRLEKDKVIRAGGLVLNRNLKRNPAGKAERAMHSTHRDTAARSACGLRLRVRD